LFGNYRVLYTVLPDSVYVLHVRHSAMRSTGPDRG
jgi:hypothetical protein